MAEEIRLDAAKTVINNYNDTHVDRFNAMVADYNSRCGQFRYRSGSLESAKSEVARFRAVLEADGRERFVRANAVPARNTGAASQKPFPDPTVQAIQARLNELGYDAGRADGAIGPRTNAAIRSFQADQGLPVNGIPDSVILERANSTTKRSQPDSQGTATDRTSGRPHRSTTTLTAAERQSIESACSTEKYVEGPAAYNACRASQLRALQGQPSRPNLSRLSSVERQSIESACSTEKYVEGPAAYNACLLSQLRAMEGQPGRPDLSRLSAAERQSIESACSTEKYVEGPAAYNACLSSQLRALDGQPGRPNLSRLSAAERQSIESACSTEKYVEGPAAYNACLSRQLARLNSK